MALGPLTLTRRNVTRRRARSALLVASIAIAFAVFGVLASFEAGFDGAGVPSERLIVTNRASGAQTLPIGHLQRVRDVPGVAQATFVWRMRASHRNPTDTMGVNAVEPHDYAAFFEGRYAFPEEAMAQLDETRDGIVVGAALATRQGWVAGERVTLTDTGRPGEPSRDWPFVVLGTFAAEERGADTNFVVARYDYVNAGREAGADTVSALAVMPEPGARAADVARAVDERFANSAFETRTQTETEFMQAFVAQFADVATIVRLVVGAALATILMIVGNTMVLVVRERRPEIGVLKVLGFSRGSILRGVLIETAALFAVGLGLGLTMAWAALAALSGPLGSIVADLSLTPEVALAGTALAALLALLTGGLPAIAAMRVPPRAALQGK